MHEVGELRAGLQAAAGGLAAMAEQQDRIAGLLAEWDIAASWLGVTDSNGVYAAEVAAAAVWASAAAELRAVVAPTQVPIGDALKQLERGGS